MSSSLNKVTLIGNLGKDPEVRSTQSGSKVVSLTLATSESWKDKGTAERKERTEWHRITIFSEGLADTVERYLRKGSKVYIEGALQTRKWTDNDGVERYTTEIVLQPYNGKMLMLDGKKLADSAGASTHQGSPAADADLDDDIPF